MDLKKIDLSDASTVAHYLHLCKLPLNPLTTYILRTEFERYYRKRVYDVSQKQIESAGYKRMSRENLVRTLFPHVIKDVNILEYHIGLPISVQEARDHFIEKTIDFEKVPKNQKELINTETGNMLDSISLQQKPLSDYIQLRNTGELMTRETFEELLKLHKTTWQGKESVGFKAPESGAIFGNLVAFNFDNKSFFPQKPATLFISRVPNHLRIPSDKDTIPDYYFQLHYMSHVSYLPDTEEGRHVLGLMKDAFKKGNLYALSSRGNVRHGRIHKKTSLSGTYGYPDDTYLVRVSGELHALGSTRFIYQFSWDEKYAPEKDPYPDEKRFPIVFA